MQTNLAFVRFNLNGHFVEGGFIISEAGTSYGLLKKEHLRESTRLIKLGSVYLKGISDHWSLHLHGRVSVVKARLMLVVFKNLSTGGGGVCSHVAAILLKTEACNTLELTKQTCTKLPCVWNQTYSKK